MVVTYTISTPMMHDARSIAMRRATAEGWGRVSVTNVKQVAKTVVDVTHAVKEYID